jgi:hypothetical protein
VLHSAEKKEIKQRHYKKFRHPQDRNLWIIYLVDLLIICYLGTLSFWFQDRKPVVMAAAISGFSAIMRRKRGPPKSRMVKETQLDNRPRYLREFPSASNITKDLELGVLFGR